MPPGGETSRYSGRFGENVLPHGSHEWLPYSKDEVLLICSNNNFPHARLTALSSSKGTETDHHQYEPTCRAEKPGIQAVPHHHAKSQTDHAPTMQMTFPAHKKHPLHIVCRGCRKLTAEICFFHRIRAGQLRAGAAQGNGAGFQNIGPVSHLERFAGILFHQ